jgi:homogentisate 1,2-dioxygenase
MPFYHRLGEIPPKRHTAYRKDGGGLYYEHLMGNKGFTGPATLLYHLRRPTSIKSVELLKKLEWKADPDARLRPRHLRLGRLPAGGSATLDRTPILFNSDVALSFAQPDRDDDFYYRNAMGDELLYVSDGLGVLESQMGELDFRRGDYLVIPRGILYRLRFAGDGPRRLFVVESAGAVETPRRYRNEFGQLMEHSPFCERDIRPPERLPVHDETGEFRLVVKQHSALNEIVLAHHPFDVVGWDGYFFPWAFNIEDFEPIVGRLHQPPPVHQTFQADGFVVCSFVPRLYDFHPEAVPAPYNHSNVMSDEVIYYAKDRFMSRKGIEYASLTLHPDGIAHGPHPGMAEKSIGQERTEELAVMVDTFRPLQVAAESLAVEDEGYTTSWLE